MCHRSIRFRVLAVLMALAVSGACTTWQPQTGPAPGTQPRSLRLWLNDGSVVMLSQAMVSADSIRGTRRGTDAGEAAYARSQVRLVEAARTNVAGTAALVVGVIAATTLALLAFGAGTGYD